MLCGNSSIGRPGTGKPLGAGLHLIGIEQHLLDVEPLVQIEQRGLDRRFEIQRVVRVGLEHPMTCKPHQLRLLLPGHGRQSLCCRVSR